MQTPVYLIIKRTGQFGENGEELVIVFDVKLSRLSADTVAKLNPGTEVLKQVADNFSVTATSDPCQTPKGGIKL